MSIKKTMLLLLALPSTLMAQESLVAGGESSKNEHGSISFTIGQIDYLNAKANNGTYSGGVQQPADTELFDIKKMCDGVQITITPNPTPNEISIVTDDDYVSYSYELYDVTTKLLSKGEISGGYEKLDMTNLVDGVYLLKINCGGDEYATFKIVKKR
ncbi:MAG: T9SS type A sorting domain-containing protein [Paludibacteraceae bacterium]|nr:T9SS type A sorting domain-containing protein [Paludibacteraceae bacterium]